MAPTQPTRKLAALMLLMLASRGVRSVRGERPEQVVTSLGLRAAAEALAAAEEGSGHQNDAAAVNALRAALDLGRAALELYAAAAGVDPVKQHGLLLTLANAVSHDSKPATNKGKGKDDNTKGRSDDGSGGDNTDASPNPADHSLLQVGKQFWHMLRD